MCIVYIKVSFVIFKLLRYQHFSKIWFNICSWEIQIFEKNRDNFFNFNIYFWLRFGLTDAIDIYFWLKIRILCVGVLKFKRLLILHTRNLLNRFLSTNHLLNLCSRAVNSQRFFCSQKAGVGIKAFWYTKSFFMCCTKF